ncbi:MAG: choice-of-anchor Q domain-containing protein [Candidatus Binatia bacterium]
MQNSCKTRTLRKVLLGGLFVTLTWPMTAHAVFRYVSPLGSNTKPSGAAKDCTKAGAPCRTIQHAVNQAASGDTISLAALPFAQNSITVDKSLNFIGNGATRVVINANGLGRHFNITNPNAFVRMSNLELINGSAPEGGSIYNTGRLTFYDNRMANNQAASNGGGIYNAGGNMVVSASEIDTNTAQHGGGIYNGEGGELTVTNGSEILNNQANFGGGIYTTSSSVYAKVQQDSTLRSNQASIDGGGIYREDGSVLQIFSPSTFENNAAGRDGGAVFNEGGALNISQGVFSGNTAGGDGGVIKHFGDEKLSVADSTFENNSATRGGVFFSASSGGVTIDKSTFNNNSATQEGGVLFNAPTGMSPSLTTITGSDFTNNSAALFGGAVSNDNGALSIGLSLFVNNSATNGGGGALKNSNSGSYSITQSIFEGNSAYLGGAIADQTTAATMILNRISASTFSDNTASNVGGALYYWDWNGRMMIVNSTFSRNTADGEGGAIYNGLSGNSSMAITNATFFGNAAEDGATIYNETVLELNNSIITDSDDLTPGDPDAACSSVGVPLTGQGNLVGIESAILFDTSCITSTTANPAFNAGWVTGFDANLQDNGGPTDTHQLFTGSNAIDKLVGCSVDHDNDPATLEVTLATDQRGYARPLGGGCDVGAVEQQ